MRRMDEVDAAIPAISATKPESVGLPTGRNEDRVQATGTLFNMRRRTFLKGLMISFAAAVMQVLGFLSPLKWARAITGFRTTGLGGGGGVNTIAIEPSGNRLVVGGDNNGPKQSVDSGATWTPAMGGLPDKSPPMQNCAVEWDPAVAGRVWLATKHFTATDGGLFVSINGGLDWTLVSSTPTFDHDPSGAGRPRIVGKLIAVKSDGTKVYLGAVDGSVYRYEGYGSNGLGGTLAPPIASLNGEQVTSIALDPNSATVLYASTRTECWKLTNVESSATATAYTSATKPGRTEELVAVKEGATTRVYAAAWTKVLRIDGSANPATGTWKDITPTGTNSTNWCSIEGVRQGSKTSVAVGSSSPGLLTGGGFDPISNNSLESVFLSTNAHAGTPTWTSICSGVATQGDLSNQNGGPGGAAWWGYLPTDQGGLSGNRMGATGYVPEQLRFKPNDPNKIFAVGTQGVFEFDRVAKLWYPMMVGLGVTTNNTVHADPNSAARVYVTNTDHVLFLSTDGLSTARKNANGAGGTVKNGYYIAFDRAVTPSRVFLAMGRDATQSPLGGEVFYHADPNTFSEWTSLGKPDASEELPIGLAVRRIGAQVIVIAAIRNRGIYRRTFTTANPPVGTSDWTPVNGTAMVGPQGTTEAPTKWENDGIVYLFDRHTGIWRSLDQGVTWDKLWGATNDNEREGFISPDPDDMTGGTLYVSMGESSANKGAWKLAGCQVSGATVENAGITKTELKKPGNVSFANAGPVVSTAGSNLYLVENAGPNVYSSADDGATWTAIGDTFYSRAGKKVSGMDVGADGSIYIAHRGPGAIRSF